ncbi:MAG: NUDIX domain-containing protein [Hyphomonadaceae bacterium]|nr:NUDIX domain-containing protein [Hyphomonadaceae bacterium]
MDNWRLKYERLITPMFRTYWRFSRAATLGVRGVATNKAGHVMLVKHTYLRGWHLPGGGVERGENAPFAIAREMEEEAGIQAIEPPVIFALYSNHANFAGDHIGLFRIGAWKACWPRADQEIAERNFFDPADPPEGTTPATLRRLAEVFRGAPVSATW